MNPLLFHHHLINLRWLVCLQCCSCLHHRSIRGLIRLQRASSLHRLAPLKIQIKRPECQLNGGVGVGGGLAIYQPCQCPTLTQ